jgi:hypothetical protein
MASYPDLEVVSTWDTYGWVENHSYVANFLGLLQLKYKCSIVVYEYAKLWFLAIIEK